MSEEIAHQDHRERYQLRLNELYLQRKDILHNLKVLARRKRVMLEASHREIPSQSNIDEPHVKVQNDAKCQENNGQGHRHLNTEEEEIKKAVDAQATIKERNKRVFGGLTSYLKKASSKREEEVEKVSDLNRQVKEKMSIEKAADEKVRQQALQFTERKRKEIEEGIAKLEVKKQTNTKDILTTQNLVLRARYSKYVKDLEDCIFTQTQPSVAWRPSLHNERTALLVSREREEREGRGKEMDQRIDRYNEPFEFTRYRLENEKEYYRNYLDNYFRRSQLFIATKTSPTVMWKPAVFNEALRKLQRGSQALLRQQAEAKLEQNDAFYRKFERDPPVEQPSEPDSE